MTESLVSLLCLGSLISLSYGVGSLLLSRIGQWVSYLEKMVFAIPLGMGIVSYFLLGCGLLRLFKPPLFVGLLALGVVAIPIFWLDCRRFRASSAPDAEPARPSLITLCIYAALAVIGICTLVASLAPPTEWDALSYHLAGPKTYLRAGRIFYVPYDHHTNFPFTLQMLYTLMLGVGSIGGAKLCHYLCGALLTASIYTFAARHLAPAGNGRRIGLLAALIFASTPMVIWEATVAYSDLATALFTWLSLYALMNSVPTVATLGQADEESASTARRLGWLVISAVMIGFALGTKFTVIAFWAFLLFGILVFHYAATRKWSPVTLRHAAVWVVVSLLVASPWYLKTWLYTGNPTYPFLYSIFHGRYWSAAAAAKYSSDQAHLGIGKSAVNLLLAPWAATTLRDGTFTEYYTFNLSPVFLAFLLALPFLGRRLSRTAALVGLFGLGVTAFWFFSVQQTRYLLPALPAFAIVCAEVAVGLTEDKQRFERHFASALVCLTALWSIYLAGGLAFWGVIDESGHHAARPAWPVVSGQVGREEYVEHGLPGIGAAEFWINANTPPDAKVAMFNLERGFYLDRTYMWAQPDHAPGLIPWDTYAGVDDWLADFKRRGYTTLLVGPAAAPNDGERWRVLLDEAVRDDKVLPVFAAPSMMTEDGPIYTKVYRIP